jgi:hypothetical protein
VKEIIVLVPENKLGVAPDEAVGTVEVDAKVKAVSATTIQNVSIVCIVVVRES